MSNAGDEVRPPTVLISGLDAIAQSVGCGRRMLKTLISEEGFPAKQWPDGTYRASPERIRAWEERYNPGGPPARE